MTGIEELRELYTDKLAKTGDFNQAFVKAVWIAYLRGYEDGSTTPEVILTPPHWAPKGDA